MRIEQMIITNLIYNEEYTRAVAPHIFSEYFHSSEENKIIRESLNFFNKYNKLIPVDVLKIELNNCKDITDKELSSINTYIDSLKYDTTVDPSWLIKSTEKFCKDKSVYNAVVKSIKIIEEKDRENTPESIPKILQDALSVSFDNHVGHDYLGDAESRFDFYHKQEDKIPFDIELLNVITSYGLDKKTLNLILAPPKVGKTLVMCHIAANTLYIGKNVLYITMEMAEERIAERIDANLLNLTIPELKTIDKDSFIKRVDKISKRTQGRLIIKEYPTTSAHVGHFKSLLRQLRTKQKFVPDLIVIDYLNICASSRIRAGAVGGTYVLVKSIAEEIRGLAVEENVPILSATQTNREGAGASDLSMNNISESFGTAATVDLMIALIRTEELDTLNQIMIKQIANRYNDPNFYKRFVIGVDQKRMKLYDVEQSAQEGLTDAGQEEIPVFERGKFGERLNEERFNGFK